VVRVRLLGDPPIGRLEYRAAARVSQASIVVAGVNRTRRLRFRAFKKNAFTKLHKESFQSRARANLRLQGYRYAVSTKLAHS
jgi:hypothetical protein